MSALDPIDSRPDAGTVSPQDADSSFTEAELAEVEALLRRLRPSPVDSGLRSRIERALAEAEEDSRIVRASRRAWAPLALPLAAAAALALLLGLPLLRPSVPSQDSPVQAGAPAPRGGVAEAGPAAPEASPPGADRLPAAPSAIPRFNPGIDQAVAARRASEELQRREVGRLVGLHNDGTVFDAQGRPWRQIRYRVDDQVEDHDNAPDGHGTRRGQIARERTLRVPMQMY